MRKKTVSCEKEGLQFCSGIRCNRKGEETGVERRRADNDRIISDSYRVTGEDNRIGHCIRLDSVGS